jgi:hypothetical protein
MTTYITSDDGGVTSRPMNETEVATYELLVADWAKEKADQDKEAAAKATAKQAVLIKLGLTADEVAALLS